MLLNTDQVKIFSIQGFSGWFNICCILNSHQGHRKMNFYPKNIPPYVYDIMYIPGWLKPNYPELNSIYCLYIKMSIKQEAPRSPNRSSVKVCLPRTINLTKSCPTILTQEDVGRTYYMDHFRN